MSQAPDPRVVGELLRDARERAGLKQEEVAEATDIGREYLSRVERGKAAEKNSAALIAAVAHVVGLTPAKLRGVGRPDAAAYLERILANDAERVLRDRVEWVRGLYGQCETDAQFARLMLAVALGETDDPGDYLRA